MRGDRGIDSPPGHFVRRRKNLADGEEIAEWAAFHHERLNGKGYPFRLGSGEISLGARIMCVADVFTDVT